LQAYRNFSFLPIDFINEDKVFDPWCDCVHYRMPM
jgi:hypothetical protein